MTYILNRQGTGKSTKLISARIQIHHIEFAENNGFALGKLINQALFTFVHDLQTDYDIGNDRYWLTYSGAGFTGYKEDGRGSRPMSARVRCDFLEYLQLNKYKVNTAINLALDRWENYYKGGNVADYVITSLKRMDGRSRNTH